MHSPSPPPPPGAVTAELRAWRAGDEAARERLLGQVYVELKKIAAAELRRERSGHTLQPTALVHEAYLRLIGQTRIDWRDRAHFFGLAATMMRRVLVDHARARLAAKRRPEEPLAELAEPSISARPVEILDLDRALDRLAGRFPRQARVVELRYFAGLELDEIAAALGISDRTVKRDWRFARAFLLAELDGERAAETSGEA
jgi:RNA polymerase sigma factor (TIGR02999 family)